jgi:hypothetical protein
MSSIAELQCRCGAVHGRVANASPETTNRMVCYCDDCQAYLHHLGRSDLLDDRGGTDIVQVAPATLSFDRGEERLVGVRLSPRGLYRWYASCCRTPLGNTLGPAIPFVGIVTRAFEVGTQRPDEVFGKPLGASQEKFAVGGPPGGKARIDVRMILHVLGLVLGWRVRGRTWPHPYFDRASRAPVRPVTTLSREDREALRPLCGPYPTAGVRVGLSGGDA